MVKLKKDTLIVVTDSEKALFLRNLTDHANPYLEVRDQEVQYNPSDMEQSANRPGRMPDTGSGQRSALDDTDWHELAKDRFARDLADKLYTEAHKGAFDELVLVASPQVLGVLREALHIEVLNRLVMDIPKTLTNHPVHEIEEIVKKEMDAG
ncbi:host attachment family protein [Roseovarius sp. ZX-A-9]|uniref:host attachment family protein n=1 Tax=Roseovarius sp. ZX-A-9 TaxID=3014783 RepID=UPI00232F59F4|nr:host attachment family protein [Roseovarius sp. ZX-A-9]